MVEVVKVILQEHVSERAVEEIMGGLAPLTADEIVEVMQHVLQTNIACCGTGGDCACAAECGGNRGRGSA